MGAWGQALQIMERRHMCLHQVLQIMDGRHPPRLGFKNLKRGRCGGGPVSWARGDSMSEAASFIRFSVVPKPWLQTGWRKRFLHVCGCACIFSAGLPKSLFLL